MSFEISKDCYEKIIEKDIRWLLENTIDCLERTHIISILKDSIKRIYKDK